jgi:hypothetical protein
MSLHGSPKGEYRNAQHEGASIGLHGSPKGEYRNAQHEGATVTRRCAIDANTAAQRRGNPTPRRSAACAPLRGLCAACGRQAN